MSLSVKKEVMKILGYDCDEDLDMHIEGFQSLCNAIIDTDAATPEEQEQITKTLRLVDNILKR